jgi:hypothetical protein
LSSMNYGEGKIEWDKPAILAGFEVRIHKPQGFIENTLDYQSVE